MIKYKVREVTLYYKSLAGAWKHVTSYFQLQNGKIVKLKFMLDYSRDIQIATRVPKYIEVPFVLTEKTTVRVENTRVFCLNYGLFSTFCSIEGQRSEILSLIFCQLKC